MGCFKCGGAYPDQDDWDGVSSCICDEYQMHYGGRAYLAAWMCLKNESHVALGERHTAVRAYHNQHVPFFVSQERERHLQERRRQLEREHQEREEAADAWAREQVRGTTQVLRLRRTCESFASALLRAGVDIDVPDSIHCTQDVSDDVHWAESFEGLLVSSI